MLDPNQIMIKNENSSIFLDSKKNPLLIEEMIFGSISGVTICIVGHPFDTLKTRI